MVHTAGLLSYLSFPNVNHFVSSASTALAEYLKQMFKEKQSKIALGDMHPI